MNRPHAENQLQKPEPCQQSSTAPSNTVPSEYPEYNLEKEAKLISQELDDQESECRHDRIYLKDRNTQSDPFWEDLYRGHCQFLDLCYSLMMNHWHPRSVRESWSSLGREELPRKVWYTGIKPCMDLLVGEDFHKWDSLFLETYRMLTLFHENQLGDNAWWFMCLGNLCTYRNAWKQISHYWITKAFSEYPSPGTIRLQLGQLGSSPCQRFYFLGVSPVCDKLPSRSTNPESAYLAAASIVRLLDPGVISGSLNTDRSLSYKIRQVSNSTRYSAMRDCAFGMLGNVLRRSDGNHILTYITSLMSVGFLATFTSDFVLIAVPWKPFVETLNIRAITNPDHTVNCIPKQLPGDCTIYGPESSNLGILKTLRVGPTILNVSTAGHVL